MRIQILGIRSKNTGADRFRRDPKMKTRTAIVIWIIALILTLNPGTIHLVSGADTNEVVLARIGQIETADAYDLWVDPNNDIAYVTCGYSGVIVLDVSEPHNPTELALMPSSSNGYAHQFVMRENLMFIGDGNGGLKIIDWANLSNPNLLSQYTGEYSWDVEVEGNTAFVANGFMGSGDRLTIVNITDPTNPMLLGSHTTVGDATDIEVAENLAFVTTSYAGITVFDVSNRTNPVQVGQYTGQSTSNAELGDLEIVDNLAYLSYWEKGLKVLNISDISSIELVAEFNESLNAFSVHIERDSSLGFLCDHELGLVVLDISIPTQPNEIGQYFDGGKPNRIQVVDNLVYMTDSDNGFVILEIIENHTFISGFELVLIVGSIVSILAVGWWLRKRKS
ncbi:MAG: LVIVD repeat-containing protein [Candidatus Thorarchaeota archaeon]